MVLLGRLIEKALFSSLLHRDDPAWLDGRDVPRGFLVEKHAVFRNLKSTIRLQTWGRQKLYVPLSAGKAAARLSFLLAGLSAFPGDPLNLHRNKKVHPLYAGSGCVTGFDFGGLAFVGALLGFGSALCGGHTKFDWRLKP